MHIGTARISSPRNDGKCLCVVHARRLAANWALYIWLARSLWSMADLPHQALYSIYSYIESQWYHVRLGRPFNWVENVLVCLFCCCWVGFCADLYFHWVTPRLSVKAVWRNVASETWIAFVITWAIIIYAEQEIRSWCLCIYIRIHAIDVTQMSLTFQKIPMRTLKSKWLV